MWVTLLSMKKLIVVYIKIYIVEVRSEEGGVDFNPVGK